MKIIVFGYIVRGPFGGMAWHHLQYVMGLQRLGHDVSFFEDSDDYASCYDPQQGSMTTDATFGLQFAAGAFEGVGLSNRWAYFDAWRDAWVGPMAGKALDALSS